MECVMDAMFPYFDSVAAVEDFDDAILNNRDCWAVACGGTEVPGISRGRWYLYVYNPALQQHAYLDIATDTVYTDLSMSVQV